jgi:hypothetical protein
MTEHEPTNPLAGRRLEPHWRRLVATLRCHGITQVVDVRANIVRYAAVFRASGYLGRIVDFEALKATHAEIARVADLDEHWIGTPSSISWRFLDSRFIS